MTTITADGIAIDCPDPLALARFYAGLLGVKPRDDYVIPPDGIINLWFQPVEGYRAPTWPSQERGQQLHLDFASDDHEATIKLALSLGATLTRRWEGYHSPILFDPVGHPFCLTDSATPGISLATLNVDCEDPRELAVFYQQLLGGHVEEYGEWTNLTRDGELAFSFQRAVGYQPPTWPTQERGQQMHIDFHSDDRSSEVREVVALGAIETGEVHDGFTVLLDPAGHPFCICDA